MNYDLMNALSNVKLRLVVLNLRYSSRRVVKFDVQFN